LNGIRTNSNHVRAETVFANATEAKAWRKRKQTQVVKDTQDLAMPKSDAEEREYVQSLASAFMYLGPGCSYNQSELNFLTSTKDPLTTAQVESYCWQVFEQIMRRHTSGRPSDLAKRTKNKYGSEETTFAERFSIIFNLMRLEKRCCIRFSNMAGWHKRFANDPKGEMAEIVKNDKVNWEKAQKSKATEVKGKKLAKKKKTLERKLAKLDIAKGTTPKKRSLDQMEAVIEYDEEIAVDTSDDESEEENSYFARSVKATPRKPSTLAPGGRGSAQTVRWRNMVTPSSPQSPSPYTSPSRRSESPLAPGYQIPNVDLDCDGVEASPSKRVKLNSGTSGYLSIPTRLGALGRSGVSSSRTVRPSPLRAESTEQDYSRLQTTSPVVRRAATLPQHSDHLIGAHAFHQTQSEYAQNQTDPHLATVSVMQWPFHLTLL
jgi:hypothetical protein